MPDPAPSPDLKALRAELDALDDRIHDALMRRAEVVAQVAEAKRHSTEDAGTALRPDREAAIARRLAARHTGSFPLMSLQRIWRELINALTQQEQAPFAIHLAPHDGGLIDAARFAFGNATPLRLHATAADALAAAEANPRDLAALALEEDGWEAIEASRGVLMRVGDVLFVGPRMDQAWDVALSIANDAPDGPDVLARAASGAALMATSAPLDPGPGLRHIGGYMDAPWIGYGLDGGV